MFRTEICLHKAFLRVAGFHYLGELSITFIKLRNLRFFNLQLRCKDKTFLLPFLIHRIRMAQSIACEDISSSIPRCLHDTPLLLGLLLTNQFRSSKVQYIDLGVGLQRNSKRRIIQESRRSIHRHRRVKSWYCFLLPTSIRYYFTLLNNLSLMDQAGSLDTDSVLSGIVFNEIQNLAKASQLHQFPEKYKCIFEFIGGLGKEGANQMQKLLLLQLRGVVLVHGIVLVQPNFAFPMPTQCHHSGRNLE